GCEGAEGLPDVDGAEDVEVGWGRQGLDEHLVIAVFEGTVLFVFHERHGVLAHVRHQFVGEAAGDDGPVLVHDRFGADGGPGDDGRHRAELLGLEEGGYGVVDVTHQGSMKTWIVPPHDIPTAKASSSAIP